MPNNCDGFTPASAPAQELAWMQQVEDRLQQMETQARLFRASVRGGAVTVYDDALRQVGRLGVGTYGLPSGGVRTGPVLSLTSPQSQFHLLIDVEDGWASPQFLYNWTQDTFVAVTSASMVSTWKCNINLLGFYIEFQHLLAVDSGTTGSVEIDIAGNRTEVQGPFSEGQHIVRWSWDLTDILSFGAQAQLRLYARRDSGSGNVNVYSPDFTKSKSLRTSVDASPDGVPNTTPVVGPNALLVEGSPAWVDGTGNQAVTNPSPSGSGTMLAIALMQGTTNAPSLTITPPPGVTTTEILAEASATFRVSAWLYTNDGNDKTFGASAGSDNRCSCILIPFDGLVASSDVSAANEASGSSVSFNSVTSQEDDTILALAYRVDASDSGAPSAYITIDTNLAEATSYRGGIWSTIASGGPTTTPPTITWSGSGTKRQYAIRLRR